MIDEATIAAKERRASASREAKRRSPAATPVKPEVSRRHVPRISATSMLSSPKKKAAAAAAAAPAATPSPARRARPVATAVAVAAPAAAAMADEAFDAADDPAISGRNAASPLPVAVAAPAAGGRRRRAPGAE
jgi:hypothetical protein